MLEIDHVSARRWGISAAAASLSGVAPSCLDCVGVGAGRSLRWRGRVWEEDIRRAAWLESFLFSTVCLSCGVVRLMGSQQAEI